MKDKKITKTITINDWIRVIPSRISNHEWNYDLILMILVTIIEVALILFLVFSILILFTKPI
jgi:hypothetical protein